jgi:hypothetical protein
MEGGRDRMLARLKNPQRRIERISRRHPRWFNHYLAMSGWEGAVASVRAEANKKYRQVDRGVAQISGRNRQMRYSISSSMSGFGLGRLFLMSEDVCSR